MPEPLLIDTKAAQDLLSIGERKLWELTNAGAIPCHRLGRAVRYCPRELAAWVASGCPCEPGSAARVRQGVRA